MPIIFIDFLCEYLGSLDVFFKLSLGQKNIIQKIASSCFSVLLLPFLCFFNSGWI